MALRLCDSAGLHYRRSDVDRPWDPPAVQGVKLRRIRQRSDRYYWVLKTGVQEHGLELSEVLAVAHDMKLWAACTTGVFSAALRGMLKKRVEVEELIPYARITSIQQEPSGPHSGRVVLLNGNRALAKIDFSAAARAILQGWLPGTGSTSSKLS